MRRSRRLTVALASLWPLAGCGQYLGSYAVEEVREVANVPESHRGSPSYGRYLAIRLASKTSLTSIGKKIYAVYVHADFCPLRHPIGLIAFGPFGYDGEDLSLPANASGLRAGSDGLFRYSLYVVVAYSAQRATQPGELQLPTYDLDGSNRDICLRLFAPGYNLIKSRSDTIRVPAAMISAALKQERISNGKNGSDVDTRSRGVVALVRDDDEEVGSRTGV
jgi:hypothetical protein